MSNDWRTHGIDRRTFLRMLGITGAMLPIPGAVACGSTTAPTATSGTNTKSAASSAVVSPAAGATQSGSAVTGTSSTAGVPFYNGTFTADMLQNPQGLDPQVNSNNESFMAMLEIYEQLIDYDPISDKYYPQLAAEMPDLSNPTQYTFKLRKGVKFHDGSEMTSDDVKATFDYIIQQGPKSPAYSLFNALDTIDAPDPYTVVMKLKVPSSSFIPYLTSIMGGIVKKGARDKQDLTKNPAGAGCGPFKFVEWASGDHLTFERFDGYFRQGYPKFQKMIYKIIVDESARIAQLLSGQIDFSGYVPPKDFQRVIKTQGMAGASFPSTRVDYVQLNLIHELGKDVHIRRAMAYAIDNEAMVKNTLFGQGVVAHGPLCPGTTYYDSSVEKSHYFDLGKAKAELTQSSQPNGFSFDLLCENNPYIVQQATLIQAMLAKVNIKANVTPLEKVAYTSKIKLGDPGWFAGVSNWTSSVNTPDYQVKLVFTTKGSYQRTSYSNPEVDQLIDQVEQTSDLTMQKQLMGKVSVLMAQDMPSIWFAWENWNVAWKDYVKGYKSVGGDYEYFDEVAIAPH